MPHVNPSPPNEIPKRKMIQLANLRSEHLFNSSGFFSSLIPPSFNSISRKPGYSFLSRNNQRSRYAGVVRAVSARDTHYYSVLNLKSNATLPEIKAAYRRLARKVIVISSALIEFNVCGIFFFFSLLCIIHDNWIVIFAYPATESK